MSLKNLLLLSLTLTGLSQAGSAYFEVPNLPVDADQHLSTEALLLRTAPYLHRTVEKMKLHEKWSVSKDEALKRLAREVSTRPETGTNLIKITIEDDKILEGYLNACVAQKTEEWRAPKLAMLDHLDMELQKQDDNMMDHRKSLTVLIQQYGIPYFKDVENSSIGEFELRQLNSMRERLLEHEREVTRLKSMIVTYNQTPENELIAASTGLELENNPVVQCLEAYRESQIRLELLRSGGLSKKHPEVRETQAQARTMQNLALKEALKLKETLQARLKYKQQEVKELKPLVEALHDDVVSLSIRTHHYERAVQDYQDARELFYQLKRDQNQKRIELAQPPHFRFYKAP